MLQGRVLRIHVKPETPGQVGLPKRPVPECPFTPAGLAGDYNRYRTEKKARDPAMAVLLMASETIQALNEEGWPVAPGDLGENVTTIGIPYGSMTPGTSFRVGHEVLLQVSKKCDPCTNLYELPYVGKEKGPGFLKATLGRRGWYARVVRPGLVRTGDPIEAVA